GCDNEGESQESITQAPRGPWCAEHHFPRPIRGASRPCVPVADVSIPRPGAAGPTPCTVYAMRRTGAASPSTPSVDGSWNSLAKGLSSLPAGARRLPEIAADIALQKFLLTLIVQCSILFVKPVGTLCRLFHQVQPGPGLRSGGPPRGPYAEKFRGLPKAW